MLKIVYKPAVIMLVTLLLAGMVYWLFPNHSVVAQEGELQPTAEPCGLPTVQSTTGNINVRSGPGLEYEVIGSIALLEVRSIVGRAGFAEWWLIELANGVSGWIANDAVEVQGNIALVPVVEPPPLPETVTPVPGIAWNPSPNPACSISGDPEATPSPGEESVDVSGGLADWSVPINLSHSGASTDPQLVVDANGLFHILWKDNVDGFLYSQGNGQEWTAPVIVEVPFGTRIYYPDLNETTPTPLFVPQLIADLEGNIHAFWIDDENGFYYSAVAAGDFATFSAWRGRQTLAEAALQQAATIDAGGRLHLAYVRPLDTEAARSGIYYRQSSNGGIEWSPAATIYQSRYFHSVAVDQVNIDIAAARSSETDRVYIAWDNRPLGRVLAARSGDGGLTWDEAFVVDGREPEDTAEAANPGNISVGALGNEVILVWGAGHNNDLCSQYYRRSADGGATWESRQPFESPRGCHESDQFLDTTLGQIVLLARVEEVVGLKTYLLAWNGEKWSQPQEQRPLVTFENPDTYLQVNFRCYQPLFIEPDTLFVAGCDGGTGQDIWITQRTLSNLADWFPPPLIWQTPTLIGVSPNQVSSLNLVTDADGLLHAFWADSSGTAINYSNRNDLFWLQPAAILRAVEGGSGEPAATIDTSNRLFVTWSGTGSGQIYFSWANAGQAGTPADWSPVQVISEPGLAAQSPNILIDAMGTIYVSYAVPLNEERGIYLVRSDDGGASWSPTIKVFDGIAAGWSMVDQPKLSTTVNGDLHLLWARYQVPFGGDPLALFYARSEDQGQSWSTPLLVAEQPVISGLVYGFGERTLHQLWFNEGNSGLDVWHNLSVDGGRSWGEAVSATGFGHVDEPFYVTTDLAGRLHLIGVVDSILHHWIWQDDRWTIESSATLTSDPEASVYDLAATIATNGNLAVVYGTTGEENALFYSGRSLELPVIVSTPVPTFTPTPPPTATPDPTNTPVPSPTVVLPTEAAPGSGPLGRGNGRDNSILDLALGFAPVVLLVAVVFFLGLRTVRVGRR